MWPRGWIETQDRPNRENISAPIRLEAGRKYYVEALMKAETYGDNVAFSWRKPGDPELFNGAPPLPGEFLSSTLVSVPATIVTQPAALAANELDTVTFRVELAGTPPYDYQWFRDGEEILGETGPSLTLPRVRATDTGAVFHVVAGNGLSSERSADAVLTVAPDLTPPSLVAIEGDARFDRVWLRFSEWLDAGPATNAANYQVSGGLAVLRATLMADERTVVLRTGPQVPGTRHTVTVGALRDLAVSANAIAPGTSASFTAFMLARGGLRLERFEAIAGHEVGHLTNHAKFPDQYDRADFVGSIEIPQNTGDNYGVRLWGFLTPPVDGDYTFYAASDDRSAVFLRTDELPANRRMIAAVTDWSPPRAWGGHESADPAQPGRRSRPIALQAGRRYYVEALMKEGSGGDHFGVAWRKPGDAEPLEGDAPIPGAYLWCYANPDLGAPDIVLEPRPATLEAGQRLSLSVRATHSSPVLAYQWQRDGVDLPGAILPDYVEAPLGFEADGAVFRCVVTSASELVVSAPAVVRVSPPEGDLPVGFARVAVDTARGLFSAVMPRRSYSFTAFGSTRFVATDGSDAFPGTETQPWRTFAHALARVGPGDVLYARAGEYVEQLLVRRSGTLERPIVVSAYPGEQVRLRAPLNPQSTSATVVLDDVRHVWLHGFEIVGFPADQGPPPQWGPECVLLLGGSDQAGLGCRILNNVCVGALGMGIADRTDRGGRHYPIEGNLVVDCEQGIVPGDRLGSHGLVIRGNALVRNRRGGLILSQTQPPVQVYNNLMVDNATGTGLFLPAFDAVVAHNVIANHAPGYGSITRCCSPTAPGRSSGAIHPRARRCSSSSHCSGTSPTSTSEFRAAAPPVDSPALLSSRALCPPRMSACSQPRSIGSPNSTADSTSRSMRPRA